MIELNVAVRVQVTADQTVFVQQRVGPAPHVHGLFDALVGFVLGEARRNVRQRVTEILRLPLPGFEDFRVGGDGALDRGGAAKPHARDDLVVGETFLGPDGIVNLGRSENGKTQAVCLHYCCHAHIYATICRMDWFSASSTCRRRSRTDFMSWTELWARSSDSCCMFSCTLDSA